MPSDETQQPLSPEEQAKKDFREKYPDLAALSDKLVEDTKNKPNRTGMAKYGGTYYKKHFADELRFVLDMMIADNKDRIYFYSKFPGFKRTTLEMKIRQSWHYLMNEMDPAGTYKKLWDKVAIKEDNNKTGIRLKFLNKELTQADIVMPDVVEDETATFDWRPELDAFLQQAPVNSVFKRENLNLMDDTVENLCANLASLTNVEFKITNRKIVIIKTE